MYLGIEYLIQHFLVNAKKDEMERNNEQVKMTSRNLLKKLEQQNGYFNHAFRGIQEKTEQVNLINGMADGINSLLTYEAYGAVARYISAQLLFDV